MSSRIKEKYGIRDAYGDYRFKVDNPVSLDMYIEIASGFFKFLVQSMLDGLHVKLPSKMGDIFVVGKKTKMKIGEDGEIKGFAPDWKETKKLWERCEECRLRKQFVYHLKVQKQPGTLAEPLVIRVHLPNRSKVDSVNLDALIQDNDILIETDLRTDVYLELVFHVQ